MPHRQDHKTMPATRDPVSLLAVDRAVFELRRGRFVCVVATGGERALILAAEGANTQTLADLTILAGCAPTLAITRQRGGGLSLREATLESESTVLNLTFDKDVEAEAIHRLADPLDDQCAQDLRQTTVSVAPKHGPASAAVGLVKIARLLPSALVAPLQKSDAADIAGWAARHNIVLVDAGDVFQFEHTSARTLSRVSEAQVPLVDAENTRVLAYRPLDGGLEHLAIVIGDPQASDKPALVRLHSECFTGDLLGSLRCDCGDQLRGAIQAIAEAGAGILIYLAQEGRGIGLVNKLRAYTLQDRGHDTLDANKQLGFDADERVYIPAAYMLTDLGLSRVRLLTNNPEKVAALTHAGIQVVERVPHTFPTNAHNEMYLRTKKNKAGHLF